MNTDILMYKLSKHQYLLSIDQSNSELYNSKIIYYKNQIGGLDDNKNNCNTIEILRSKPDKILWNNKHILDTDFKNRCFTSSTRIDKRIADIEEEIKGINIRNRDRDNSPTTLEGYILRNQSRRIDMDKIKELNNEKLKLNLKMIECYKYIRDRKCTNK